jgi:hypothetical protein
VADDHAAGIDQHIQGKISVACFNPFDRPCRSPAR